MGRAPADVGEVIRMSRNPRRAYDANGVKPNVSRPVGSLAAASGYSKPRASRRPKPPDDKAARPKLPSTSLQRC